MWFTPIVSQPVTATATPVVRSFGIEGNSNSIISGQISIVKLDSSRTYVAAGGPFLPTNAAYAPFRSLINSVSTTIIVEADSPIGQQAYTTPGTYSWTCPPGVTSVCVVCIGGGGGGADGWANPAGAGAGLGWKNNIPVVPGQSYTVQVGAGGGNGGNGGNSFFIDLATVAGYGGGYGGGSGTGGPNANGRGGGWVGDGGGAGGDANSYQAGGGAGGYTGRGGNASGGNPESDSGGAGAGYYYSSTYGSGAGGGTGILGKGTTGRGGASAGSTTYYAGEGGSGGSRGMYGENPWSGTGESSSNVQGGNYGGGGGGPGTAWPSASGNGGPGAVRIIWGKNLSINLDRRFPNTGTQDIV